MVRVELGRELRVELGDPVGVFVIPGACMSSRGSSSMVREPWSGDRGAGSASREPRTAQLEAFTHGPQKTGRLRKCKGYCPISYIG